MLLFLQKNLNLSNVNCLPLSDTEVLGDPKFEKIPFNSRMVLLVEVVCIYTRTYINKYINTVLI